MGKLLDIGRTVSTVVGALTLWALATGVIASWVLRRVKRARLNYPGESSGSPGSPGGRGSPGGPDSSARQAPVAAALPLDRRAQTWADVPSWVARDRQWAVAVVLLGAPEIAERTHGFVDFSRRRIDWSGLLAEAAGWPRRQRLLVAVAHDLAGSLQQASDAPPIVAPDAVAVADLVTDLDEYALGRVHTAVDLRRGTCSFDEAVERAGGLG